MSADAMVLEGSTASSKFDEARALQKEGRFADAANAWVEGIETDPTQLRAHLGLTESLIALQLNEAASIAAHQALMVDSRSAEAHFLLAVVLTRLGDKDEAVREYRAALKGRHSFPEALNNLGSLLCSRREYKEAESCYRKALAQKQKYAAAWNNLANMQLELAKLGDAEISYSRAIAADPNYAEAHTSLAMLHLLKGDFARGWNEYQWRWRGGKPRQLPKPEWDGSFLGEKTILVHAEQGAGDTIQFVRYARILKAEGASVILHCQKSLKKLLSAMPELDSVVCEQDTISPFDVHAPLLDLPRLCGTELLTIPGDVPYLQIPPDATAPDALANAQRPKIGLVWAGNPGHHNDRNRSVTPQLFDPLLRSNLGSFFSLQVGSAPPAHWTGESLIVDLAPELVDYSVTAACLAEMDLLITVDTSVAHLAGALGKPVWLLLPVCNDWRWLRDRDDSPWYPTIRLFRQKSIGDWQSVLKSLTQEFQVWAKCAIGERAQ